MGAVTHDVVKLYSIMNQIRLDQQGNCIAFGTDMPWDDAYQSPSFITISNYFRYRCLNIVALNDPLSWTEVPIVVDATDLKKRDIDFGNSLLLEFLTGQKDLSLDNATYRAVSDSFHFAELALRRGDITQAKTELTAIEPSAPVWTQETKDYFIAKINTYLGL